MPKGIFERKAGIKYGRPKGSVNKPRIKMMNDAENAEMSAKVLEMDKKEVQA